MQQSKQKIRAGQGEGRNAPAERCGCSPDRKAIEGLIQQCREQPLASDKAIDGFNIGVNYGPSAGQTVGCVLVPLMPRPAGDVANPRGGVRGVIPEKQDYIME